MVTYAECASDDGPNTLRSLPPPHKRKALVASKRRGWVSGGVSGALSDSRAGCQACVCAAGYAGSPILGRVASRFAGVGNDRPNHVGFLRQLPTCRHRQLSRPRFKRPTHAFAVIRADHAIALSSTIRQTGLLSLLCCQVWKVYRTLQVRILQVRTLQVSILQVRKAQVRTLQVAS